MSHEQPAQATQNYGPPLPVGMMHVFAQPYVAWSALCGQAIPSGGGTTGIYYYRRAEYCRDCVMLANAQGIFPTGRVGQ